MVKKWKMMLLLIATVFVSITGGCDVLNKCVPCGDFMINCNTAGGCAVCFSLDLATGEMKWGYEDGSYMIMDTDIASGTMTMTFYDSYGVICYTAVVDPLTSSITYTVNGKEYTVNQDETWTCPDGSTWVMPDECAELGLDIPGSEDDQEGCPDMMTLPPCD